jgi:hypothetical protein
MDRSTGMGGFVRVVSKDAKTPGAGARAMASEYSRVLRELPNLIAAQDEYDSLDYSGLDHNNRPVPPDAMDFSAYRNALAECHTVAKCEPYSGSGLVAPVIQNLPAPAGQPSARDDVTIIVTDLQPDDQDAPGDGGKIGMALRKIVAGGDRAVGLVGVRSHYMGPVYDLPGGHSLEWVAGAQPFFLIIIGPRAPWRTCRTG